MTHMKIWMLLAAGVLAAGQAPAADPPKVDPMILTEGFLSAHPDLRWRMEGLQAYEKKDYARAMDLLRRAAGYADKPSQAIIAEMYWKGTGVPKDRPLAYAWMDIAAERLYSDLVVFRETYWNALTEAEREEAIRRGQPLLAEYGDDVAKPRLEKILKREKRNVTGSRVGYVGNLTIIPFTGPLAGSGMAVSGDEYYAKKYWEPKFYWEYQDRLWKAPLRGRVLVGELEDVEGEGRPEHQDDKDAED